jgi:nicotinamide riboside transporter PnuC
MIDPDNSLLQAVIVVTGVIGNIFNARRDSRGFCFWMVTNALMIYTSWVVGAWGSAALFFYYGMASIYALRHWKKLDQNLFRHLPIESDQE